MSVCVFLGVSWGWGGGRKRGIGIEGRRGRGGREGEGQTAGMRNGRMTLNDLIAFMEETIYFYTVV